MYWLDASSRASVRCATCSSSTFGSPARPTRPGWSRCRRGSSRASCSRRSPTSKRLYDARRCARRARARRPDRSPARSASGDRGLRRRRSRSKLTLAAHLARHRARPLAATSCCSPCRQSSAPGDARMPPMILLPLVQHAVRSVSRRACRGPRLATVEGDRRRVTVVGAAMPSRVRGPRRRRRVGVGGVTAAVRERLAPLYGDRRRADLAAGRGRSQPSRPGDSA